MEKDRVTFKELGQIMMDFKDRYYGQILSPGIEDKVTKEVIDELGKYYVTDVDNHFPDTWTIVVTKDIHKKILEIKINEFDHYINMGVKDTGDR